MSAGAGLPSGTVARVSGVGVGMMAAWARMWLPAATGDRVAGLGLALGAAVVVACLAAFWGTNPGHADRLLILAGAGYAATTLLPAWAGVPPRGRPLLGTVAVVAGGVAFAAGLFLVTQVGPRTLLLWWLTLAWFTAASGVLVARHGWRRWRVLLFPLGFTLFALPIPLRVLNPLQDALQEQTTRRSCQALRLLGYEVVRAEFVLQLPGGRLRVEEACSGVRSVTALAAAAAFVAFLKGFGPIRGGVLLALAVPVIAAVNVLRVVGSGVIQQAFGSAYLEGAWHEALGCSAVFAGLALTLGLARLLGTSPAAEVTPGVAAVSAGSGWPTAAGVAVGVALSLAALALGTRAEGRADGVAPLDAIALSLPPWSGEARVVPAVVTELLAADRQIHRVYTDAVGAEASVWVFYWGTATAIRGEHHPDICWGNRGFEAADAWVETVKSVAATAREFRQGSERQIVVTWTQEGRHVWTAADEATARSDILSSGVGEHRWVGRLLGATSDAGPRLQVVVVVRGAGPGARRDAAAVSRLVAAELYRVCPWAEPGP